jgi:hypothetical protein
MPGDAAPSRRQRDPVSAVMEPRRPGGAQSSREARGYVQGGPAGRCRAGVLARAAPVHDGQRRPRHAAGRGTRGGAGLLIGHVATTASQALRYGRALKA